MSLLEELAQNGVSTEDLEKAASVRLFEKVATDEGIDLSTLDDSQIEELFVHFVENVLPGMNPEGDTDMSNSAEKAASILLFQKQADAEGVDLENMSEAEVEALYAHFLEEVLPNMFESHAEEKQASAEIEEAQAKLAEMEILGRHMARAFYDESEKIAEPYAFKGKDLVGEGKESINRFVGPKAKGRVEKMRAAISGMSKTKKGLAALGAAGVLGAGAYGIHKYRNQDKEASVTLTLGELDELMKVAADQKMSVSAPSMTEADYRRARRNTRAAVVNPDIHGVGEALREHKNKRTFALMKREPDPSVLDRLKGAARSSYGKFKNLPGYQKALLGVGGAGLAAGAGYAGYKAMKSRDKEAGLDEVIEEIAEQRALELLLEAGYELE